MKSKLSPVLSRADYPLLYWMFADDRACGRYDLVPSGAVRLPYFALHYARLRGGIQAALKWVDLARVRRDEKQALEARRGFQSGTARFQPYKDSQALAAADNVTLARLGGHELLYQGAFCCLSVEPQGLLVLVGWVV